MSLKWLCIVSFLLLITTATAGAQDISRCSTEGHTAPVITKHELNGVVALTIEKGDHAPSDEQYATIRSVLMRASAMGFNTWRAFFNPDEVREHTNRIADDPNHLPQFGCRNGLVFIADTVDAIVPKLNDEELRGYIQGLETMGALAFVVNDANQYSIEALEQMVMRIRAVSNLPIMASFTGSANIAAYPMFDYYEAQTFGTTDEFVDFLARPFDVYCLDARESMTARGLQERGDILLAIRPRAFFYYTAVADDWLAMPNEEIETITGIIKHWKTVS
jgi:hypothetical protein